MDEPKKKELNYFHYDRIVSIFFGSTKIIYRIYDLRKEEWAQFGHSSEGSVLAACLCPTDLFEYYGNDDFISNGMLIGEEAKELAKCSERYGYLYVDKLSDKVEYLFATEPNIKRPLKQEKPRLFQRAVVQYFKEFIERFISNDDSVISKYRFLVTYPSHWTLEQAAYLRSLLQMAGIVEEHDHPDRLIMYNEGEAIVRYIQSPIYNFPNVREGQKYMICDLSGSKVEMHLYNIEGPINSHSEIKTTSRFNWYNGTIKEPVQMLINYGDFYLETMIYLSSLLSTPSINITIIELELLHNGEGIFVNWRKLEKLECLTEDEVRMNTHITCYISESLYDLYYEKSTTEQLPQWILDGYIDIYPRDFKEKVLKPFCDRITRYIKKVSKTVTDIIDDVILMSNKERTYLMKLIADDYKEKAEKKMYIVSIDNMTYGAVLKYLDLAAFNIYKPRIVHDDLHLLDKPRINNTQDVIILIDYGLEKTQVSYIHDRTGQTASDKNIKHIMKLPSQTEFNGSFPTLNAMLISKSSLNFGEDSKIDLPWTHNLFGNFLSPNSKTMFFLQENEGHSQKILTRAITEFYTFKKDIYGIILVKHRRNIVEELLITTTTTNSASSSFEETRKRISFKEFSLLYFEYLADFLHTYIYSKTGIEKDKYRYCITHDNSGYPEKFTLSNKDIRQIALESNLISADILTSLHVLERTEATAIYCRKLVDTTKANSKEDHLYFLQIQLHSNRCLLILNTVPLLDNEDSNSYKESGKFWECVHKYARIENASINFTNIIFENLWKHIQKIESFLLRKCKQHQTQKIFFSSKNMQIIEAMFYNYISSTKDLNLENSEKEHTIRMCDKSLESCCYLLMTNMDLLEFVFNPVINQLVSVIQSNIFKQNLLQGIQISDIFVMGEFFNCHDYVSYKFLEELLLTKLRNIHFPRFDNLILQNMTKKTRVRKLNVREYQQGQDDNAEDRHDSLAQISSSGSIIFSIDPRNLLVERVVTRTYIIKLDHSQRTKVVYNHSGRSFDDKYSIHIVISKGTPITSLGLIEDTISKHFMVSTNYKKLELCGFNIELLVLEDDNVSYLTDTSMNKIIWRDKFFNSNFEILKVLHITNNNFDDHSYPISFNFRFSQTETYKFWVEKGKDRKEKVEYIRELILLKSCHHE